MSKSMSFELPVKFITALAVPQELLLPVLSQFKSTLFELPTKLMTPQFFYLYMLKINIKNDQHT